MRPQLVAGVGTDPRPGSPRPARSTSPGRRACTSSTPNCRSTNRMPGSTVGHRACSARSVTRSMASAGRHLDDQRVLALERRVAAGPGRRSQVRRELPLQVVDRQVDPQLHRGRPRRMPYPAVSPSARAKCLPSSACGRGITCTDTSSPTCRGRLRAGLGGRLDRADVSDDGDRHQAVADLLAADDGDVRRLDHGVGSGQRGDVPLGLDHAEGVLCHWLSFVQSRPSVGAGRSWRLVDRADDQRVDRRVAPANQPTRPSPVATSTRSPTPLPSTSNATSVRPPPSTSTSRKAPLGISVDSPGRPDGAGDGCSQHRRSFSISTPRLRARSRAIGVSTARGASTSRAPVRPPRAPCAR